MMRHQEAHQLKQPLISVVMSVFNGELYLSEAVESILNQTESNFEFVIINDGSSDGSREQLEGISKPIPACGSFINPIEV